MVAQLDAALEQYARIVEQDLQISVRDIAGAGAAGGLGAGLIAFLGARLRPGAQIVLEAVGLEDALSKADLVITAEGQLDEQTSYGKSVSAVAKHAKRYHLPVLVLAGGLGKGYRQVYDLGVDAVFVLPSSPMSLDHAMQHAAELATDATERMLRLFKAGTILR
jgi:glycerate 2-kinase